MNRILPLLILFCLIFSFSCKRTTTPQAGEEEMFEEPFDSTLHVYLYGICIDSLNTEDFQIKNGDHPTRIFQSLGFSAAEADRISKEAAGVLDPTKLQAGRHYTAFTTMDSVETVQYIAFAKSLTDYAVIDLTAADTISTYEFSKPITYKRRYVEGVLNTSLWNDLRSKGTNPLLALHIEDVYAWQIDFFDVKKGDSYKVMYDVAFIDDTTELNISTIAGALFTHQGKEYMAVPFTQDSVPEYFDVQGESLRRAFLKAPLDFFRISSRFSNSRFHPVLKIYRAHHGVDYAAPSGTPVKSIGDGVVVAKGYESGGGNFLKVKHNSVYTTTYMHLKGFAKGIQQGARVRQGEVIGYVGSTGLSTGPHLDFRVHKNGQPIDPLKMESPPTHPVHPELMDSFLIARQNMLMEMDSLRVTFNAAHPSIVMEEE